MTFGDGLGEARQFVDGLLGRSSRQEDDNRNYSEHSENDECRLGQLAAISQQGKREEKNGKHCADHRHMIQQQMKVYDVHVPSRNRDALAIVPTSSGYSVV